MKRVLLVAIFVLFLIPILVIAQNQTANLTATGQKISSTLEQEIEIPENLQLAAKILLGLKPDTKVTFQEFIILIMTFVIFFFIIRDVMVFVPFFDTTIKSIIGAVLVTLLTGISGGFLLFVDLMLSLSSFFGILERWPIITIVLVFILLFGLSFILNKVLTQLKQKTQIEIAKGEGLKTGAATKLVQKQAEIMGGGG
ncbi:MAG: hypothetical protein QW622_02260 [Candidatus Pacearchaeota archaeon]